MGGGKGNYRKKKRPSSMTVYNRELQKEERSSSEAEDFFDKQQGIYVKEGKRCEAGSCKREAVCTVYVRDEEDYYEELEDAEGIPARACRHHATKKTFNRGTILRAISEVLSDEEAVATPSLPNKSDSETENQTDKENAEPSIRITPQDSPALKALLTVTEKSDYSIQNAKNPTQSPDLVCERKGCANTAKYEAKLEGQTHMARVCLEHAIDKIDDKLTKSPMQTNKADMSDCQPATVLIDTVRNDKADQTTKQAVNTS